MTSVILCSFFVSLLKDGLTALLLAAKHSHVEACSTLLDCGAEINTSDNSGRYIKQAVRHIVGYWSDVEVVISMRFCVCCRTALMLAAESNAASVVEVLVQRGADLSAVDTEGHDVLHYAKVSGSSEAQAVLSAALNRHLASGES